MAEIKNVVMTITKGASASWVLVTYDLHFEVSELNVQFVERLTLRGQDPVRDDNLATVLENRLLTPATQVITSGAMVQIPNDVLDEDRDRMLGPIVVRNEDDLYARVALGRLFSTSPVTVQDSNLVRGHFGKGA